MLETADNESQRMSALHIVASIVNRRSDGEYSLLSLWLDIGRTHSIGISLELTTFLNDILASYWVTEVASSTLPVERRTWAIKSWTWVGATLVLWNIHQLTTYTDLESASRTKTPTRHEVCRKVIRCFR